MKAVWLAYDGTLFDTKVECAEYEKTQKGPILRDGMLEFIENNCPTTYNDDAGFSLIDTDDVLNFIEVHRDKIAEFITEYNKIYG